MTILRAAIEKETAGSKRWFILQSMFGFACLRVSGASPQDGLSAYAALFERGAEADKADATYQLNQAINEFVFSVIGRMNDLGLRVDPQTQETLLKAWSAYIVSLGQPKPRQAKRREPDWSTAIAKSNSQELFVPHVEKQLDDPTVPKAYGFLKAAAAVLQYQKPEQAVELLQQAKPLLAKDDAEEAADLYSRLVNLLVKQEGQLSQAIAVQQEYVKQSGRGQARLGMLHLRNQDEAALDAVIKALGAADASEREINELGDKLQNLAHDALRFGLWW